MITDTDADRTTSHPQSFETMLTDKGECAAPPALAKDGFRGLLYRATMTFRFCEA